MNVTASCDMCDMLYDRFVTAVTIMSFFFKSTIYNAGRDGRL